MKTAYTYRLIWLLVFMICGTAGAWGLDTTPQYGDKYYYNYVAADDVNRFEVLSALVNGTEIGTKWEGKYVKDIPWNGSRGFWWTADRNGSLVMTVDCGSESHEPYYRLGIGEVQTQDERPNGIKIEQSNTNNGNDWKEILNKELPTNVDGEYTEWVTLSIPITKRYFRVTFTQKEDKHLAFNYFNMSTLPTIKHKHAKWYELRSGVDAADSFNESNDMMHPEDNKFIEHYDNPIQSAHIYLDTIYMHRGTSIELTLPDALDDNYSIQSYQRWYSFRKDKTFETSNHADNVYDLLTPTGGTVYRFANGYVGNPVGTKAMSMNFYMPTEAEFKDWFSDISGPDFDGKWFIVACDVSPYKDFTKTYDATNSPKSVFWDGNSIECWEPTLSHRVLFYIAAADGRGGADDPGAANWKNGLGRLSDEAYQGGTNTGNEKYLEEYTVTRPFYRLNNKQGDKNFADALALSKDAQSYVIPDMKDYDIIVTKDSKDIKELDVTIVDNTAGITLLNTTLSGESRIISFDYPTKYLTNSWQVNVNEKDGSSSATVLVTKTIKNGTTSTTYNIARYKLVFEKNATLLPQSVIKGLENNEYEKDSEWYRYKTRTPEYMKENYQLVTSLTWDYDKNIPMQVNNQKEFYPFPMDWGYSSYGFYDGTAVGNEFANTKPVPEWGHYGITNLYMEKYDKWLSGGGTKSQATITSPEGGTYHLYVDASERPGTIAQLPFKEKLCPGAELFVSAWVKEAGWADGSPGTGLQFTIMGITAAGTSVPLCRYGTGQFRRTSYLSSSIPGCGGAGTANEKNEWLHVYFSFINRSEVDDAYVSYELHIDNNSVSSNGADMYVDAVRVFVAQPTAVVKQMQAICEQEQETQMNITLDWDRLMSRIGGTAGSDNEVGAMAFCFIDRIKFEEKLAELEKQGTNTYTKNVATALEYAAEATGEDDFYQKFSQLHYYMNYDDKRLHDYGAEFEDGTGTYHWLSDNVQKLNGEDRGFFYRYTKDGIRSLTGDFKSKLSVNRPYWMLIILTNTSGSRPQAADFAADFGQPCAIKTEFYVEATNQIKIEGEIIDPTANEYCANQQLNFRPYMRYSYEKDAEGNPIYVYISDEINFDWFLETEENFISKGEDGNGVSVYEALEKFRSYAPTADELPDSYIADMNDKGFTEAMYNTLSKYHKEGILVLKRQSYNITLKTPGVDFVVKPIKTDVEVDESLVCWNYIPLSLRVVDDAPSLAIGYSGLKYPDTEGKKFSSNLRIGLQQINKAVTADNALICNLRTATLVDSNNNTHVGRVTAHESDNKIYLTDTNDPDMAEYLELDKDVSLQYALPIGWVDYLRSYKPSTDYTEPNQLKFHFDLNGEIGSKQKPDFKFVPHEGYYYEFCVYFEEKKMTNGNSESSSNSCIGMLHVKMYVVPEYLIWNGTGTDNWSNDDNWKRVNAADRINKAEGSYEEYTEQAFVPMQFSKVILPRDSKVELYVAGYDQNGNWNTNGLPSEDFGKPTENIMYDLLVVEQPEGNENAGRLTTDRYRAYWIDQIHFEPGAQMRGAEYLIYNKAEVDYELKPLEWHSITSPLQGTVAGDFYTNKNTAREQSEYFTDITFNTDNNSRLSPYVFQRDWDAGSAMLKLTDGTENDVAFTGNWSGVYNDVDEYETYQPGCGFSLKVTKMPGNNEKALFRLPKADESYDYYYYNTSNNDVIPILNTSVKEHRTDNHGKLISDGLFNRVAYNWDSSVGKDITIHLPKASKGTLYMIGNPFMTDLDVEKFFDGNEKVLQQKYWLTNGDKAASGSNDDWISSDANGNKNIPPLTAFFVQKAEDVTSENDEITLTQEMQATFTTTQTSGAKRGGVLHLTATDIDGRTSSAAVVYDNNATAGYGDDRDVVMFVNPANNDIPLVYTVGGNHALTINATPGGGRIPLGVYSRNEGTVTLRFTGSETCGDVRLYDARNSRYTPLTEDFTLTVSANDEGRYYLVGGDDGGISLRDDNTQGSISVYSVRPGEICVVSSTADIASVKVYGVGGDMVATASDSGSAVRINVTPGMVYVVKATDAEGHCRIVKVKG